MKIYTVHTKNYESELSKVNKEDVPEDVLAELKQKHDLENEDIYTYKETPLEKRAESAVFVPESISVMALIFPLNFIWAITNKAWLFLAVLLVYFFSSFPLSFLEKDLAHTIGMAKLAMFPFLGIWANDFIRWQLKFRGYRLESVVSGKNESEAQLRFFEHYIGHLKNNKS